jgi:hypothetical protein
MHVVTMFSALLSKVKPPRKRLQISHGIVVE